MQGTDAARRALAALAWLVYPLAVWAGVAAGETRAVAVLTLAALGLRTWLHRRRIRSADAARLLAPLAAAGLPAAAAAWLGDPRLLLFVPALVSLGLLGAFAATLLRGPPLVETLARLEVGELSVAEVRYCRGVTVLWCAFFVANALVAGWLALRGPLAAWALWTGALSYLAIALLLAAEWTVRAWRFRRYGGGPAGALLSRLFPPHRESPLR